MDVLDYLNSKPGFSYKQAGANNIHTACFYCDEDPSKRGRLYINVDPNMSPPGLFHCHLCGEQGAINKLRKHYGDPPLDDAGNEFSKGGRAISASNLAILKAATAYYQDKVVDNEKAFDWLITERGLTAQTIADHRLGWADGGLGKHLLASGFTKQDLDACNLIKPDGSDFFVNRITIPYMVNGNVLQIRGKDMNGKYFTPPGDQVRPYNIDAANGASIVVITEGEFDALVVEQMGYSVIGVPGAVSWQESWNVYLDDAKKIYAVFDRDDSGARGFERVSKMLGGRVRQVLMPEHKDLEKKNDPSEWMVKKGHTPAEFAALIAAASGSLLVSVFDALSEWEKMEGNPVKNRMTTGFSRLDMIIDGGIQNGQVVVLMAKTGVGKTAALVNMFHRIIADDSSKKILFFSLEQTRNEWFDRALKVFSFFNKPEPRNLAQLAQWRKIMSEKDKRGMYRESLSRTQVENMINFYRDNLMIVDKNRVTEDDIRACVEEFIDVQGRKPDLIAIDYLGYWARAFKGEAYQRTTDAVMKLKELAKDINVPIIAPHQVNRSANDQRLDLASSRDSGAVEETADFLLALQRMAISKADERNGGMHAVNSSELILDVIKSRHGGAGQNISLVDAPLSLALIQRADNEQQTALYQHQLHERSERLNDFYLRQASGVKDTSPDWRDLAFRRLEDAINARPGRS